MSQHIFVDKLSGGLALLRLQWIIWKFGHGSSVAVDHLEVWSWFKSHWETFVFCPEESHPTRCRDFFPWEWKCRRTQDQDCKNVSDHQLMCILCRCSGGCQVTCWPSQRHDGCHSYWGLRRPPFVTGATSGIGKAYAMELAQRGLNIVLVSRCDEKLRQVAKEIEGQYGRKTHTIRVDFTHGHNIYPLIAKRLQGLEIGILVNNVAMCYSDDFASFLEIADAEQKITEVLDCNALSVAQTTRLVLPGMLKRRTGLIINISSQMGIHPQPLLALYSATKAFVMYFSQCLHAEYKAEGITVQCVAPFLVSTNMNKMKSSGHVKSAAAFAREALNTVGYSSYTSGCLLHALQSFAIGLIIPDCLRMSSFLVAKLHDTAHRRKIQKGLHMDS